MKHANPMTLSAICLAGLMAAGSAANAAQPAATAKLPPEMKQGNITYMSGGIGKGEAAAMRHEESRFPLTLEFLKREKAKNEYLAGVSVKIADHEGKTVLDTLTGGPFLLAKLPDGKYTVTADDHGKQKERTVVVAANKKERVVFEW